MASWSPKNSSHWKGHVRFTLILRYINEALSTLWYHDHRVDFTSQNTYKGLLGFYCLFNQYGRDDFTGEQVGRVTPIDKIGTDPYRFNNYTRELALVQSMLYAGEKKQDPPKPQAFACKKSDPAEAEE